MPSLQPQVAAQSEAPQPSSPPPPIPEIAATDDHTSRENIGAPTPAPPPPAAPAALDNTATLMVHVVAKETGKPLSAVNVYLMPKVPEAGKSVTASKNSSGTMGQGLRPGDDGTVEFTSVPSGKELRLHAGGDWNVTGSANQELNSLARGERREVRVELPTQNDLTLVGRVIARADRTPVVHARVGTSRAESHTTVETDESGRSINRTARSRTDLGETFTDSDGYFEISLAKWRLPHLRVEAEGYALAIIVPNHGHETRESAQTIELDKSATLRARVIDASGAPMSGVMLLLSTPAYAFQRHDAEDSGDFGYYSLPDEQWNAESKVDGTCTIEKLPPGIPLAVRLKSGAKIVHRIPEPLLFMPAETRDVEWRIGAGCTLSGVAIDQDGHPAVAQEIWLEKQQYAGPRARYFQPYVRDESVARAKTDAEGRFEFKDVAAGTWWVGPAAFYRSAKSSGDTALAPLADTVEVGTSPSQDIVLHVYRDLFIRGTIVDPNGAPVPRGWISGAPEPQQYGVNTSAEKDGTFALGPLGPGTFAIRGSGQPFASSDVVKADAGARDVIIRLRPGSGLRGRLVDAQTGIATTGEIMLKAETPRQGPFGQGLSTHTQEDGTFDIKGLEPGRFGIVARAADGRFGVLSGIDATAAHTVDDLVVSMSPGGTLRLRYDGTKPHISLKITTHDLPISWGESLELEKPLEKRAPQGALVLQVLADDNMSVKRSISVDLAAGETKEVVIHDDK
jgi:protocatechuate 3,4-dioxygenase beta subunit